MPQAPRPNKKAMKIAYEILKTPKYRQQKNEPNPPEKMVDSWIRDSSTNQ
jgi:hypothetical protein